MAIPVDVWGRRNILMLGSAGGAFSMLVIAIYIAVAQPQANPTTDIPPSGRAAIAFFYIWTVFYSVGWNGTPWVVNSEIFPGSVRTLTQTLAAMSNWLWNFGTSFYGRGDVSADFAALSFFSFPSLFFFFFFSPSQSFRERHPQCLFAWVRVAGVSVRCPSSFLDVWS